MKRKEISNEEKRNEKKMAKAIANEANTMKWRTKRPMKAKACEEMA